MRLFGRNKPNAEAPAAQRRFQALGQRAIDGDGVLAPHAQKAAIGRGEVLKAVATLNKYKEGKANLEQKIIDNEQWYKLRHWECMRKSNQQKDEVEPSSAWLFNSIANKHADAMDNYPSPNVLPREEGDKGEAEMLTSISPVILDQNDFEEVYSDEQNYKLKTGCGAYGVFWDKTKLSGLGDISIQKIDLINLFWEPGIMDIQRSRNVFHVELMDNDLLIAAYPQLANQLGGSSVDVSRYVQDDTVSTEEKSAVVDWYYKRSANGKTVLHYCKFVGDVVLFSTENDPAFATRGLYDHGLYPFIIDPLYKIEGTIAGFGFVDISKDAQGYIDRGNQAIMKNMLSNTKPRYFVRTDGGVKEEEYADMTKDFVHTDGNLGQDDILPIQGKPLSEIYVQVINNKIDELKETSGNRDVSTGGTTGGVTAASGLAAMMEAGSKLSRDNNKGSYRAYKRICEMIIELIRQFYTLPRKFRILGEDGTRRYIAYSNANIRPQPQGEEFGRDLGYRLPLFDVEVTAQKQSPYSKMAQNELALQFYKSGFFNPQLADQALACLDMMDFDRKHFIMQKIQQNGTMYHQLLATQRQVVALAALLDKQNGTRYAEKFAAQMGGQPTVQGGAPGASLEDVEALGGKEGAKESHVTKNVRERVAESTSPT
ncbi:MAG: hypothetical protein J6D16_03425 [Clostridia bacterium]|nr:hypothetical protein [Clostridia bacterium]